MLPDARSALLFPFERNSAGEFRIATPDEIEEDFARVKAMEPNHVAFYYKAPGGIFLKDSDITSILRKQLVDIDHALSVSYIDYTKWPIPARLAVMDMAFNMGLAKISRKYPALNRYLMAMNWQGASLQCGRNTSNPAFNRRNAWTKAEFLKAATEV